MDIEQARFNMIEQQIRPWEVLDDRVLEVIGRIRREDFVPEAHRAMAFADLNIPLAHGEVMMQPKVEARLLQALALDENDTVLEIGTGSGYLTALLAAQAKQVYSIDIHEDFIESAKQKLDRIWINNTVLEVADGANGWNKHTPYDAIILTGSVPVLDEQFKKMLAPNGRLVAVVGQSPVMEALLIERIGESGWRETSLFDTDLPPLKNAEAPSSFTF